MKTSRLKTIEEIMRAKPVTNGDMRDVPKSQGPFLREKCIARICTGNDVMRAWHCPLFFGAGSSRKSSKMAFSSTKRIGNLT